MDTNRRLIGLYSPAPQSGKSTVATQLALMGNFSLFSFALPIKRMVVEVLNAAGYNSSEIGYFMAEGKEEPIERVGGASFRYLAQTIGTEWGRNMVENDLWVNLLLNNPNLPTYTVIDDVRFANEYNAIRAKGGEVWRIRRPSGFVSTAHVSEGQLDGMTFDYEITNDGSYADLNEKVKYGLNR